MAWTDGETTGKDRMARRNGSVGQIEDDGMIDRID